GRILRVRRGAGFMPTISDPGKAALAAGTVRLARPLLARHPSLHALATPADPDLNDEERAFLDGPVEQACRMTDDWRVHEERDLPKEVWQFLAQERFFGLVIPKEYGGVGMSASANSAVVTKLTSRSLPLAIT